MMDINNINANIPDYEGTHNINLGCNKWKICNGLMVK